MIKDIYIQPIFILRYVVINLLGLIVVSCGTAPTKETPEPPPPGEVTSKPLNTDSIQSDKLSAAQSVSYIEALTELNNGNIKESIKTLEKLNQKGDFVSVQRNLALAYYQIEKYDQAQQVLSSALTLSEGDARLHNLQGLIKLKTNKHKEAESAFRSATELNGEYALAYYNLALLYDIYYQDVKTAYDFYLKYLNLIDYKDESTLTWVEQLKYSIGE